MKLQERLRRVMRDGNLTVADLARWFSRPYPTIRSWVENGVAVGGGPRDIEATNTRLTKLESLVKRSKKFPVPRLSPSARIAWLDDLRKERRAP